MEKSTPSSWASGAWCNASAASPSAIARQLTAPLYCASPLVIVASIQILESVASVVHPEAHWVSSLGRTMQRWVGMTGRRNAACHLEMLTAMCRNDWKNDWMHWCKGLKTMVTSCPLDHPYALEPYKWVIFDDKERCSNQSIGLSTTCYLEEETKDSQWVHCSVWYVRLSSQWCITLWNFVKCLLCLGMSKDDEIIHIICYYYFYSLIKEVLTMKSSNQHHH